MLVSIQTLCQCINWPRHPLKPHSGPFSDSPFVCLDPASPCIVPWLASILGREAPPCPSQSSCLAQGRSHHRLEIWTFQFLCPIGWPYPLLGLGGEQGAACPKSMGTRSSTWSTCQDHSFLLPTWLLPPASPSYCSLHFRPLKALTLIFVGKFSEPRSLKVVLTYVLWLS